MEVVIVFLFALSTVLIIAGLVIKYRTSRPTKSDANEQVVTTNQTIVGRSLEKLANKQKILDYINKKGRASNAELRELIGVTDRTIVRYMDELENEGKIRQIGDTGRGVFYHRH